MINLVLCDDSEEMLNIMREKILSYTEINQYSESFNIECYTSSKSLWFDIQEKRPVDIFILDVGMPELDGFHLAEKIRNVRPNAIIIFLTSYIDKATEGYKFHALRYIYKSRLDTELFEAMDEAIRELQKINDSSIVVKRYNNLVKVLYREIKYVRHINRALEIYTETQGLFIDPRGIKEIYMQLSDSRFVFIDRSSFVNVDFIRQIVSGEIILTDGGKLEISRRMMQSVKLAIAKRWTQC